MVAWCFQPNYCYIHFQYVVAWWKIIFQKSKRPQTHLLMSFNSIRIMAGYTFSTPKINMCSDCWWWLGVSNQTIAIYTFNMLLLEGKSFFRSQKDLKLKNWWDSVPLDIWLVKYFITKNQIVQWLVMFAWCLQPKALLYSLSICYWSMQFLFRSQKTSNSFTYELQ